MISFSNFDNVQITFVNSYERINIKELFNMKLRIRKIPSFSKIPVVLPSALMLPALLSSTLMFPSSPAFAACSYADASSNNGWGWDPVARRSCPPLASEPSPSNGGGSGTTACPDGVLNSGFREQRQRIDMVILTAGQSNAVGYDSFQNNTSNDSPDQNVLVWAGGSWRVADVRAQNPRWHTANGHSRVGQSHAGFHIAKYLSEQECKVVGIIPTGINGAFIDQWDGFNSPGFSEIREQASQAIGRATRVSDVSLIWWMQGESHHGSNLNGYRRGRADLIEDLTNQSWFNNNPVFIASKTANNSTSINPVIEELNTDNDDHAITCTTSGGANLATVGSGNPHFTGRSLEQIGRQVGQLFLDNCGAGRAGDSNSPSSGSSGGSNGTCTEDRDYQFASQNGGWGWDEDARESCPPR